MHLVGFYFKSKMGLNSLTPNDSYSGRTAPLNVALYIFIQQI